MFQIRLNNLNASHCKHLNNGDIVKARVFQRLSPTQAYLNIRGVKLLAEARVYIPDAASYRIERREGLLIFHLLQRGSDSPAMTVSRRMSQEKSIIKSFLLKNNTENRNYIAVLKRLLSGKSYQGITFRKVFPFLALCMESGYLPNIENLGFLFKKNIRFSSNPKYQFLKKLSNNFFKNTENYYETDFFERIKEDRFYKEILEKKNMEVSERFRNFLASILTKSYFYKEFCVFGRPGRMVYLHFRRFDLKAVKLKIETRVCGDVKIFLLQQRKQFFIDVYYRNEGIEHYCRPLVKLMKEKIITADFPEPVVNTYTGGTDNVFLLGNEKIFDIINKTEDETE